MLNFPQIFATLGLCPIKPPFFRFYVVLLVELLPFRAALVPAKNRSCLWFLRMAVSIRPPMPVYRFPGRCRRITGGNEPSLVNTLETVHAGVASINGFSSCKSSPEVGFSK